MVLVASFALLALFSIVAVVLSGEDTREYRDPRENPMLWDTLLHH
jgi:hypothetical protein